MYHMYARKFIGNIIQSVTVACHSDWQRHRGEGSTDGVPQPAGRALQEERRVCSPAGPGSLHQGSTSGARWLHRRGYHLQPRNLKALKPYCKYAEFSCWTCWKLGLMLVGCDLRTAGSFRNYVDPRISVELLNYFFALPTSSI